MGEEWNQARIQALILTQTEENYKLEFKGANSIGRSDRKRTDISTDISAMANHAGGTVIYGIKEFDNPEKSHRPEKIEPIDRQEYSKEWLDQVINSNIQPPIMGIVIHPVTIDNDDAKVIFVVEIPQSKTAHQSRDKRYYRRDNFTIRQMEDAEIRDVMHRMQHPNVSIDIYPLNKKRESAIHQYRLGVVVDNPGPVIINHLKLEINFPDFGQVMTFNQPPNNQLSPFGYFFTSRLPKISYSFTYFRTQMPIFPNDSIVLTDLLAIEYQITDDVYRNIQFRVNNGTSAFLTWRVYADEMPQKKGEIPFASLHNF